MKTKTAEKVSTPLATVKAAELHRWLSDVEPFKGHDDTLPMLTAVHIESDGHRLLAVTTDRFTIGVAKLDYETDHVPNSKVCTESEHNNVAFNLAPNDVATLIKVSKTVKKDQGWRCVTIIQNYDDTIEFRFFSGEQITVKPFDVQFPQWRQLIPSSGSQIERAATQYAAPYMARFAKVAADAAMRVTTFDNKVGRGQRPTVVQIGDDFIGMIMPWRFGDEQTPEFNRPEWIE